MSVYKEPLDWVCQSIDSVLSQTYSDFEFLIVDDNPIDNLLLDFLKDYQNKDSRIRIIVNEHNIGLTKSLNVALKQAIGKYIARMDADDISHKNRFQVQYDFMEAHPDVDVCGTWAKFFGEVGFFNEKRRMMPTTTEEIHIYSLFASPLVHPSVFIRNYRSIHYDNHVIKAQDYELWSRLLDEKKTLRNIGQILIEYRITGKSQEKKYVDLQKQTSNIAYIRLLNAIIPTVTDQEIDIHSSICNWNSCNILDAEKWLKKLRVVLLIKYPNNKKFICNTINLFWFNTCIANNRIFSAYHRSELAHMSFPIIIRELKYCIKIM